jgi:hypothetical protein
MTLVIATAAALAVILGLALVGRRLTRRDERAQISLDDHARRAFVIANPNRRSF